MVMEADLESTALGYIVYDTREFPQKDGVYKTAVELTNEIMEGVTKVANSHSIMTAGLFITDSGAQLILLTRALEKEPVDDRMKCILKRVTYDEATGYMHTYVIPILETSATEELEKSTVY